MIYLVTGGSGSGKSEYAEKKLCELCEKKGNSKIYLATMIPYGKESEEKIKRHRNMRAEKNFQTEECFTNFLTFAETMQRHQSINPGKTEGLLLECMSNLVANELFDENGLGTFWKKKQPEITTDELAGKLEDSILEGIRLLNDIYEDIVVVTNEVFSESAIYSKEMRLYKRVLGNINCRLAELAKEATEVVYGQPVSYKQDKEQKMDKEKAGLHLIIGGAYQGKLNYAKKLYPHIQWADGEKDSFETLQHAEGIYHFELYIKRMLEDKNVDVEKIAETILGTATQRVLLCNEIGYGLVPVDTFERYYREQVGRVCSVIAEQADCVTRVVCGIGMSLKS